MLYHVSGTQLLDQDNNPVYLQSILQMENGRVRKYPDNYNFTDNSDEAWVVKDPTPDGRTSLKEATEAGVNFIDLMGMWLPKMHNGSSVGTTYLDGTVLKVAEWCEQLGVPYLIDMYDPHNWDLTWGTYHIPVWMRQEAGYSSSLTTMAQMADVNNKFWAGLLPNSWNNYMDAWKYIASKVKDKPHFIGFSPSNEAMHHTYDYMSTNPADWNSSEKLGVSYRDLNEEFTDEVRAITGEDHLIFVDKPYLRSIQKNGDYSVLKDIRRSNIVWEFHQYYPHWRGPTVADYLTGIKEYENVVVTGFGKPLYIGEWSTYKQSWLDSINRPQETFDTFREIADYFRTGLGFAGDCFYSYEHLWGNCAGYPSGTFGSFFSPAETQLFLAGMWEGELPAPPNGGNEMSFEYKNEDNVDLTVYKRKIVVQDTPVTIPAGGSVLIELDADEILVQK